ncbi:hypothetical protein MHU86_11638 [Fragilaria crotonensis]|nr:hypothetical protein MHU86_11638 [Fragilaria crotonensis]
MLCWRRNSIARDPSHNQKLNIPSGAISLATDDHAVARRRGAFALNFTNMRLLLLWLFLSDSTRAFTSAPKGWRLQLTNCKARLKQVAESAGADEASSVATTKSAAKKFNEVVTKNRPNVVRKKTAWEHAWVPNGERREKVKSLIKEMQREHLRSYHKDTKDWEDVKVFLEDGMDILVQWAQLGEGARCETLANEMLDRCASWMTNWLEYYDLQVKIRRRVLHAYYNQLQRITWNGTSKKPKFQLSSSEAMLGREVLEKADAALQLMERLSLDYVMKARDQSKNMRPLLDASDYAPLILGYNQVGGKAVPALHALRRLTNLFDRSDHLERLAPSTSLYLAVCKAIFNYSDAQDWQNRVGKSQTEMVDLLCKECVEYSRQFPSLLQSNINLYNVALDGWSKALPPITRERGIASSSRVFGNNDNQSKIDQVANSVSDLYCMLHEDGLIPNAKTFTSLIYAFTKSGKIDEAYVLKEKLVARLSADPEIKEKLMGEPCACLRRVWLEAFPLPRMNH